MALDIHRHWWLLKRAWKNCSVLLFYDNHRSISGRFSPRARSIVGADEGGVDHPLAPLRSRRREGRVIPERSFGQIFFSYPSRTLRAWKCKDCRVMVSRYCQRDYEE